MQGIRDIHAKAAVSGVTVSGEYKSKHSSTAATLAPAVYACSQHTQFLLQELNSDRAFSEGVRTVGGACGYDWVVS